MEKPDRVFGSIVLTLVYSIAIFVAVNSVSYANLHPTVLSGQELYSPTNAITQFKHTPQPVTSLNNFNNFPVPSFNFSFPGFGEIVRGCELLFETTFVLYKRILFNIPLRYRKTSIIFPFHYFW